MNPHTPQQTNNLPTPTIVNRRGAAVGARLLSLSRGGRGHFFCLEAIKMSQLMKLICAIERKGYHVQWGDDGEPKLTPINDPHCEPGKLQQWYSDRFAAWLEGQWRSHISETVAPEASYGWCQAIETVANYCGIEWEPRDAWLTRQGDDTDG